MPLGHEDGDAFASGSGKSSLVFDTIAAESQRMINEIYSGFVQGFMPSRREVDILEGLTTASTKIRVTCSRRPRTRSGPRPTIPCSVE